MDTLTPQERLEIYKAMLGRLIADREHSLRRGHELYGFCWALAASCIDSHGIENFPELMAIKPEKTFDEDYWWATHPKSTARIDKLRKIIERMEKEQTKTN